MKNLKTPILALSEIACDFYELRFAWDPDAGVPRPGQFLTVRAAQSSIPLLRRPFAFSAYNKETGEAALIFQKKGPGTDIMAGYKPGDLLDCIGPLGNFFGEPLESERPILVAGGVGLGPMLFLARWLVDSGYDPLFVFGARSKALVPSVLESASGFSAAICTDDSSLGFGGNVVEYLSTADLPGKGCLYCCGPSPMLKGCFTFAQQHGYRCQVSVEQVMACGVGACMGCVVKTVSGYARACKEGPVFDGEVLEWS